MLNMTPFFQFLKFSRERTPLDIHLLTYCLHFEEMVALKSIFNFIISGLKLGIKILFSSFLLLIFFT